MSGKKALLVLARAGMEISWRYAWVGFLMLLARSLDRRPMRIPKAWLDKIDTTIIST